MRTVRMWIDVTYDPDLTDPDALAEALDRVMGTALSTPGILDSVGCPEVGEFFPAEVQ